MSTFKTWPQIAAGLPAMLDQQTYDSLRSKYFQQAVAPGLKSKGLNPDNFMQQFWQRTERPPVTNLAQRALAGINIAGIESAITGLTQLKNLPEVGKVLSRGVLAGFEQEDADTVRSQAGLGGVPHCRRSIS